MAAAISQDPNLDSLSSFLPGRSQAAFNKTRQFLNQQNVPVDQSLKQALLFGESLVEQGLDATIEWCEILVEYLYDYGIMERIGNINAFARDGLEIGIQLGLNTLKTLDAADVAKIVGLLALVFIAPNVLAFNAPEVLAIAAQLGTKIWNLP